MTATVDADGGSQLLFAGLGPYLIVNLDIANDVFISQARTVHTTDTPLPPQASVQLEGPWYVSTCAQGTVVEVAVLPGSAGGYSNPVGVQLALSALGLATAANQATQNATAQATNTVLGSGIALPVGAAKETGNLALLGSGIALPVGAAKETGNLALLGSGIALPVGAAKETGGNLASAAGLLAGTSAGALLGVAGNTIGKEIASWLAGGAVGATPGGVPLLKSHNVLFSAASTSLTVGTPVQVPGAIKSFSQVGYSLFFGCYASAAAQLQVNVEWFDTASGQAVEQQTYWINPGNGSGNPHNVRITGPTEGNGVQVTLTAFTGNITVTNLLFAQSSTVYLRHFPLTTVMTTLAGVTNVAFTDPLAYLLGDISATALSTGANQATVPAFYAGRVQLFGGTTSATTDCSVNISVTADQSAAGSHTIYQDNTDAKGFLNAYVTLPRSQCTVTVTNQNAGTQSCRFTLVVAPEG